MKLLSFVQSELESNQIITQNQISVEESLSNNIDEQIVKGQQNLSKLKFFDASKIGLNESIQLIKGENSMNRVGQVKKIKKFQQKKKEKMNRNCILKQIAMDDILGVLENL